MIYLSMNMYSLEEFPRIFHFTNTFPDLGIELFPLFHKEGYEEILAKYEDELKKHPLSCHEQYYEADNSAEPDTALYKKTEIYFQKTLSLCRRLDIRHIVLHYNNRIVPESASEKSKMLALAKSRLSHITEAAKSNGVSVLVENTGVPVCCNVLLNEAEFIHECKSCGHKVLIDIGHALCNKWNMEYVISELKEQIAAYHIHNNDGIHDSHRRMHDGKGDLESFKRSYLKHTPKADLILEYTVREKDDISGIEEDIRELYRLQGC